MATLTRAAVLEEGDATRSLLYSIPAPFPTECLIGLEGSSDDEILNELAAERVEYDVPEIVSERPLRDIQLSIVAVQQSCMTTLANLLSVTTALPSSSVQPRIAREHQSSPVPTMDVVNTWSNTSALGALVQALQVLDGIVDYGNSHTPAKEESQGIVREAALLMQLHDLVDAHVPSMHRHDAHLAQAIIGLLTDLHQLSTSFVSTPELSLSLSSRQSTSRSLPQSPSIPAVEDDPHAVLTTLQKQLSSLQSSNSVDTSTSAATPTTTAAHHLHAALLWARIDEQLATVVALCKTRGLTSSGHRTPDNADPFSDAAAISGAASTDLSVDAPSVPSFDEDHMPPQYEYEYDVVNGELPPAYAADLALAHGHGSLVDQKQMSKYPPEKASGEFSALSPTVSHPHQSSSLDLDLVTQAIDRLYAVAPQLHDQRVELRQEKIAQMQKAQHTINKGKARDATSVREAELEKMLDLLGRASSREIPDQSVVIDRTRKARIKKKLDLKEQRYTYIEHIVERAAAGRLHSQDATPSSTPSLTANPGLHRRLGAENEQIRSNHSPRDGGGTELLLKGSAATPEAKNTSGNLSVPTHKESRSRSVSAPHLAFFRSMSWDRSCAASSTQDPHSYGPKNSSSSVRRLSERFGSRSRPASSGGPTISSTLDVVYVAEHHEMLKHVLVFVSLPSFSSHGNPNANGQPASSGILTAEVLADTSSQTRGDQLMLRLSGTPSLPLGLPVPVVPGLKNAIEKRTYWEIKLSCVQRPQLFGIRNSANVTSSENDDPPLLSASQLTTLLPISYTCAFCLVPLVTPAPTQYRDLPSEYWEELVDAWMCHPEEQTLADLKMNMRGEEGKSGRKFGFWPTEGEALVGGSYIMFEGRSVVGRNVTEIVGTNRGESACLIRCLCGAIIGRRQERRLENGSTLKMYRLSKYAIRLISAAAECPKIPMSAFIVRDMIEHVQAHATYRFVLSDEEKERPRILVWLFKPRIRISYMLTSPLFLPWSDSIEASKVLYKILGPDSTTDIKELLNKYPGFPQAEHLYYPMGVCRKLASLLSESTRAYPDSLRTMTGLEVGWLHRG